MQSISAASDSRDFRFTINNGTQINAVNRVNQFRFVAYSRPWGTAGKFSTLCVGSPKPPYSAKRDSDRRTKDKKHVILEYVALPYDEWTEDMKRKRKSTANRIMTVLKAALNHAWLNERVDDAGAWQKVKPYRGADAPKVKYLTSKEAERLFAAASDHFQPMAKAALLTGCRYGELSRLQSEDFAQGQIFVREEKSDKPRHVPLSKEGIKFFRGLAKGKNKTDLLLTHEDGSAWGRVRTKPSPCVKRARAPA